MSTSILVEPESEATIGPHSPSPNDLISESSVTKFSTQNSKRPGLRLPGRIKI